MPREIQPPRANARPKNMLSSTKGQGSLRMPLNDDREEKAVRFHSRQALHEMQINQIKAAASPARKRRSLGASGGMGTPDKENDGMGVVGGTMVSPVKRVPILANFEEWMKMATDNKINATNSWNFALIDYFHDMSLLKEGDSVNFQKASCTLDGCVKIYTSRVDSVATETGKLLSGLADSGNKRGKGGEGDDETGDGNNEEDDEEGEEGVKKRAKKRAQRSSEATLATSFAQLQLKKMELEFSVDPLFKKASADFDEGGAKGLLLNHLTMDAQGRIVFDSSDDAQDVEPSRSDSEDEGNEASQKAASEEAPSENQQVADIDLGALGLKFFPDLSKVDEQDICPSMKSYELGGDNASTGIQFLKATDDWKRDEPDTNHMSANGDGTQDDGFSAPAMEDDMDDGEIGGFDVGADVGFGEGGEAWAREAAINTQGRPYNETSETAVGGDDDGDAVSNEVGSFESGSSHYGVHLSKDKDFDKENILSYFDQALQKNWAGPEHWRIRKIKDAAKPAGTATKKKEKEPFEIDFASPMTQAMADALYTRASTNSTISLPKSQWKSKSRNLLPDDKHFNSRQLLSLFLKPKARIGSKKLVSSLSRRQQEQLPPGELDEAYWAQQQQQISSQDGEDGPHGNYDANFFQDDGLGVGGGMEDDDDDFADARERLSPGLEGADQQPFTQGSIDSLITGEVQQGAYGSQLVTQSRRLRPEYVQYARVAKKVDVRRLKEEMWKGIGLEETQSSQEVSSATTPPSVDKEIDTSLKFTSIMNNLQTAYPKQAMADISTSYCFICLLHLANEKGLVLENDPSFQEIRIQRDHTAVITEHGE